MVTAAFSWWGQKSVIILVPSLTAVTSDLLGVSWLCLQSAFGVWGQLSHPLDTLALPILSSLHCSDSLYIVLWTLRSTSNPTCSLFLLSYTWSPSKFVSSTWGSQIVFSTFSECEHLLLPQSSLILPIQRDYFHIGFFNLPPHQITLQNIVSQWCLFF